MGSVSPKQNDKTLSIIISRGIAAIIGGYVLANLVVILLSYWLPMPQPERVMTSMLGSFAIYAAAIMWVFSTKTATKAWAGLIVPCVISAVWIFILMPEKLL